MADDWSAFPDAKPARAPKAAKRDAWADFPDAGDHTVSSVHDGDTLKVEDHPVRLWGADAPELRQQGLGADGRPVDIGRQSQADLNALVGGQIVTLGPPQGSSYQRTVAPITLHGADVAQTLVRQGSAVAAPQYLDADPERKFTYTQAERLARQNGLGIHDTTFQPPAEYRKAPLPVADLIPEREQYARYWDTPTKQNGMRPEVETRFVEMMNDSSVPVDDVVKFARVNGFVTDPALLKRNRDYSKRSGKPIQLNYDEPRQVMTHQGDGATGATARGLGNGVLPNWLEETGAIVDSLGGTQGRENVFNSDRRLADIWANNAAQNESITAFDASAHPYATTAGQIVGGVVLPMGKIETAADLAKWGAAYGFAGGAGHPGSIPERLTSGVVGMGEGVATTVAGGKLLEKGVPYLRAKFGKKGEVAGEAAVDAAEGAADGSVPRPGQDGPVPPVGAKPGAVPMASEPSVSVSAPATPPEWPTTTQRLDQPLANPSLRAAAESAHPSDVVPIPANEVGSAEEAAAIDKGRFGEAKTPDPRAVLEGGKVRGWNGSEVPVRGPVDLVGWVRQNGGLRDHGGELAHMGLDNRGRSGMDLVGQEARFGPLIHDGGMSFDDAALRAWEAGYFPGHTDRPDVNEFLDAVRGTHEGWDRRFTANDYPQLEAYRAAQDERHALDVERGNAPDGKVWADKSEPAGPEAPFPPVSAYEEWPAGGPDYAGNIKLDKLETPQDIKRALDFTERKVGFDAATRGRVSQAETGRLAGELGMTPEKLLSRRKGQALNAEEALAARQILAKSGNELVNLARRVKSMDVPGDEDLAAFRQAWMRHAAIQEQVAGATAEAGRALAQFRMLANSRAVKADVLSGLLSAGGGRQRITEAADVLIDAVEMGPGKFNTLVEKASKPRFRDKLVELYINMLLSGPQTHAVNIVSNTLTAIASLPEHGAAAVMGAARRAIDPKADRVLFSEVGARGFGLLQGAKEGARLFANSVKTGEPSDLVSKVEGMGHRNISGLKGEVIRLPTRFLTAEDEFFKGIARRMSLNADAVRTARSEALKGADARKRIAELVENPTDAMLARAFDEARYRTFQQKLGPGAAKIAGLTEDWPILKPFLPFIRTPTNLLKYAVERSPAAPFLREWRAEFQAGGGRRDLAMAKMLLGTGFGMAVYEAAKAGKISGTAPTDDAKARLLYADGWQPYSVLIGDQWYSYKRLDPFSTTIGVAADLALLPDGMSARQQQDQAGLLIASIMGNLANKTWLSGLSDIVSALNEPDRGNADRLWQRFVGAATVPALAAQVARTIDPVSRVTETTGDYIKSRVPGLSETLPARRDVWGEPVASEGGVGPDILSPMWTSTAKDDPVNAELLRAGIKIGMPQKTVAGQRLSAEDYSRYQAEAGSRAYLGIKELIGSPDWKAMDGDEKEKAVADLVREARADARANLSPSPVKKEGEGWGAFPSAKAAADPWAGFHDVPQEDLASKLRAAVPGLHVTSGYRTPEYQDDMRKRGYHPADNSGHLDGSSLDLVPPAGWTFAKLAREVKRLRPDARLLPEGDHLHVTFPGWYGAPVLGGAKGWGIRNPNAAGG